MDSNEIEIGGVPIGPTEIVTFGTMLSALLVLIFHRDWGLAAHIQTLAAQALIVLPVVLGVLRSFKHHLATKVVIAKIAAVPGPAVTPSAITYSSGNYGSGSTTTLVSSLAPDPNLGADVAPVDVDTVPEDLPQ